MSNVNEQLKHIFVHVPKSAGSSMEAIAWVGGTGHETLQSMKNRGIDLDAYWKWGFVRNPLERTVSAYYFLRIHHGTNNQFAWIKPCNTFSRFVEAIDANPEWLESAVGSPFVHVIPQYRFFEVDGKCAADFIGKVDTIAADWETICQRIAKGTVKLGNLNKSRKQPVAWNKEYNEDTRAVIQRIYAKDFLF